MRSRQTRPRSEPHRAGHVQRHVERALLRYKSSKPLLKTLPTRGHGMMAGPATMPASSGSATGGRRLRRSRATTTPPRSSRTRAPHRVRRRDPARHLHHGRPADRRLDGTPFRRSVGSADRARWWTGIGPRRGRLRQLRRRVATVGGPSWSSTLLPVAIAGHTHGHPSAPEERMLILAEAPGPATTSSSSARRPAATGIGGASVLASATSRTRTLPSGRAVQVGGPVRRKAPSLRPA